MYHKRYKSGIGCVIITVTLRDMAVIMTIFNSPFLSDFMVRNLWTFHKLCTSTSNGRWCEVVQLKALTDEDARHMTSIRLKKCNARPCCISLSARSSSKINNFLNFYIKGKRVFVVVKWLLAVTNFRCLLPIGNTLLVFPSWADGRWLIKWQSRKCQMNSEQLTYIDCGDKVHK